MKNVLLLTDLSVQSLSPIHSIVKEAKNEKLNINIVHMLSLPTSITELLFLEENKPYKAVPDNFLEAFQMLWNKYNKAVYKIEFNFVYCSTSRYLNNFIEGSNIDKVYMLDKYDYKQPLQESQKFTGFIDKCKVPLIKLPMQGESFSEYQILSSLLGSDTGETIASTNPAKSRNELLLN